MFPISRFARKIVKPSEGVAAVEFALIAPATIMLFFGIVVFSSVLWTYSALQQIAAEAARAALPGQNTAQQSQFANSYVSGAIGSYSFLNPSNLTVSTTGTATTFNVTLTYNASGSFFNIFGASIFSVPLQISRGATIQVGGF